MNPHVLIIRFFLCNEHARLMISDFCFKYTTFTVAEFLTLNKITKNRFIYRKFAIT